MAFPTSPTNGQTTTQNGQVYTWNAALGVWALTAGTTGDISGSSVTATANISGGNILTAGIMSSTGNTTGGNINTAGLVSATGNIVGGNINTAGLLSAVGNIVGGNIITGGALTAASYSAVGNITGNYFLGNGALLTGVITSVANINNGTSNVTVVSSGGNITVGVGGTSNVAVFATTGEFVTGLISASGNITGSNVLTAGSVSAGGNVIGPNFSDATGTYNVNLGSSGSAGRGAVAGYSGGAYGGVGYNITHTATSGVYNKPLADQTSYLRFDSGGFNFLSNSSTVAASGITMTSRVLIDNGGNITPGATGAQDLGTASLRWRNIYTSDLHLNNGIGSYTIVEGEDDLFLYNNRNGKTYKFALTEVDPSIVPPKMKTD